jgi:hypothetical protein
MEEVQTHIVRRPKVALSGHSINILHLRNPLAVAWWSCVYPGFGHLRLGSFGKGIFLFGGELLINTQAHINLAIIYSFTGNFLVAKQVLDARLLLLYCGILVYSVWDSYRIAIEINKLSILADHENASVPPMIVASMGINALEKRNPWVAVAWSAMIPGLGHLYCQTLISAIFLLIGGGTILYLSHLLPAIGFTALSNLTQAKVVLDWQWLLNVPSFYCFSMYDAYCKCVEINKLFDQEQTQFLRRNYQNSRFLMPL